MCRGDEVRGDEAAEQAEQYGEERGFDFPLAVQ
jgi:hypothetical protein